VAVAVFAAGSPRKRTPLASPGFSDWISQPDKSSKITCHMGLARGPIPGL
jgi:hypothetical protein